MPEMIETSYPMPFDMLDEGQVIQAVHGIPHGSSVTIDVATMTGVCEEANGRCIMFPKWTPVETITVDLPVRVMRGVPVPTTGCRDLPGCWREVNVRLPGGAPDEH